MDGEELFWRFDSTGRLNFQPIKTAGNCTSASPKSIFFWGREGPRTPCQTRAYGARERPRVNPVFNRPPYLVRSRLCYSVEYALFSVARCQALTSVTLSGGLSNSGWEYEHPALIGRPDQLTVRKSPRPVTTLSPRNRKQ